MIPDKLIYPAYVFFVCLALVLVFAFPLTPHIHDRRLKKQYYLLQLATFLAALIGAKLAVLIGDWNWPIVPLDDWNRLWSGRSILGALIVGFLVAELAKLLMRYPLPPNDRFAVLLPFSIATGRIGCLIQGCCPGIPYEGFGYVTYDDGIPRYPAQAVELGFNLLVGLGFIVLFRKKLLQGHLFAVYLIVYGLFRFWHEELRATPKHWHPWSAYQAMALVMAVLGLAFFVKRSFRPPAAWSPTLVMGAVHDQRGLQYLWQSQAGNR